MSICRFKALHGRPGHVTLDNGAVALNLSAHLALGFFLYSKGDLLIRKMNIIRTLGLTYILYTKITNKDLLHSTGNYFQYL